MDDENFILLDEDDTCLFDEIFPLQKPVPGDLAEQADTTPLTSDESRKVMLEKCVVLRFTVDQMRMQMSCCGLLSRTDVVGCTLKAEELLSCTRQQFYESFRMKEMAGNRSVDHTVPESLYPLRVVMKNSEVALDSYVVEAFINDLEFSISNDSMTNLAGFMQDEKATYASLLRVRLNLNSIRLNLTNRRFPDPVCITLGSGTILQGPWGDDATSVPAEHRPKDPGTHRTARENEPLKRQPKAALERTRS